MTFRKICQKCSCSHITPSRRNVRSMWQLTHGLPLTKKAALLYCYSAHCKWIPTSGQNIDAMEHQPTDIHREETAAAASTMTNI